MRIRGCVECERLWREYRDATFKYVKLDGQAKMAEMRYEVDTKLQTDLKAANLQRDIALEQSQQHEATHVNRVAAADSTELKA
jgi:hypothetical protein